MNDWEYKLCHTTIVFIRAHKLVDTVVVMLCLIPMLGSTPPSSQCILPQCAGEPGRSADIPTAATVSSPTHPHTHCCISRRCKYCIACRRESRNKTLSTTIYHIQCKTHHSKIQRGNLKLYHMSVYCVLPYSGRQSYKSSHLVHHAVYVFRFTVHKCIGQVEQSGATLTNIIQIQSHGHPVL